VEAAVPAADGGREAIEAAEPAVDGGQGTGDRGVAAVAATEDGGPETEEGVGAAADGGRETEEADVPAADGGQRTGDRDGAAVAATEDGGRKTDEAAVPAADGGQRTGDGEDAAPAATSDGGRGLEAVDEASRSEVSSSGAETVMIDTVPLPESPAPVSAGNEMDPDPVDKDQIAAGESQDNSGGENIYSQSNPIPIAGQGQAGEPAAIMGESSMLRDQTSESTPEGNSVTSGSEVIEEEAVSQILEQLPEGAEEYSRSAAADLLAQSADRDPGDIIANQHQDIQSQFSDISEGQIDGLIAISLNTAIRQLDDTIAGIKEALGDSSQQKSTVQYDPGLPGETEGGKGGLDDLKGKLDSMNELSEMTSLRLQMTMDRRSKFISTLSQMMKKISTTQDILVQNIK